MLEEVLRGELFHVENEKKLGSTWKKRKLHQLLTKSSWSCYFLPSLSVLSSRRHVRGKVQVLGLHELPRITKAH